MSHNYINKKDFKHEEFTTSNYKNYFTSNLDEFKNKKLESTYFHAKNDNEVAGNLRSDDLCVIKHKQFDDKYYNLISNINNGYGFSNSKIINCPYNIREVYRDKIIEVEIEEMVPVYKEVYTPVEIIIPKPVDKVKYSDSSVENNKPTYHDKVINIDIKDVNKYKNAYKILPIKINKIQKEVNIERPCIVENIEYRDIIVKKEIIGNSTKNIVYNVENNNNKLYNNLTPNKVINVNNNNNTDSSNSDSYKNINKKENTEEIIYEKIPIYVEQEEIIENIIKVPVIYNKIIENQVNTNNNNTHIKEKIIESNYYKPKEIINKIKKNKNILKNSEITEEVPIYKNQVITKKVEKNPQIISKIMCKNPKEVEDIIEEEVIIPLEKYIELPEENIIYNYYDIEVESSEIEDNIEYINGEKVRVINIIKENVIPNIIENIKEENIKIKKPKGKKVKENISYKEVIENIVKEVPLEIVKTTPNIITNTIKKDIYVTDYKSTLKTTNPDLLSTYRDSVRQLNDSKLQNLSLKAELDSFNNMQKNLKNYISYKDQNIILRNTIDRLKDYISKEQTDISLLQSKIK